MSCPKYIEFISATLDAEASKDERVELEQHLQHCSECQKRLAGQRALKHAVARLPGRASPPEAILARIEALRFRSPQGSLWPRRRPWLRRAGHLGLVAAGLAMALLAGRLLTDASEPSLPEELIADHLKYVPEDMPADVAGGDEDEVRRFFASKVEFPPVVPHLDGSLLLGGRACRIKGRMMQLLFYQRGRQKLSLYVGSGTPGLDGCRGRDGHSVCGARRGALSLMLVGDAPDGELQRLLASASL